MIKINLEVKWCGACPFAKWDFTAREVYCRASRYKRKIADIQKPVDKTWDKLKEIPAWCPWRPGNEEMNAYLWYKVYKGD